MPMNNLNLTNARYFHMPVPSPPTAFYHDMLLTEHWAITVDSSLRRDMSRLLYGKGLTFFNSSYAMRFYFSSLHNQKQGASSAVNK